jgi:hypothetical protein
MAGRHNRGGLTMTNNPFDAVYAGMDPAEDGHDLDPANVIEAPDEQGCYDNGWQLCLIWCGIHKEYEWQWVDLGRLLKAGGVPADAQGYRLRPTAPRLIVNNDRR